MLSANHTQYWETVKECLEQLHAFSPRNAAISIQEYLVFVISQNIENAIYHDEPYEVSCDIAGVEGKYKEHWGKYLKIRAEYFSSPDNVISMAAKSVTSSRKIPDSKNLAGRPRRSLDLEQLQAARTEGRKVARKAGGQKAAAKGRAPKKPVSKPEVSKKTLAKKVAPRKPTTGKAASKKSATGKVAPEKPASKSKGRRVVK